LGRWSGSARQHRRDAGGGHDRTALLQGRVARHFRSLTPLDLLSILQFGILALVILPILPDRNFGPYDALNPRNIWLMVVLISGVSLAGYAPCAWSARAMALP
jgi:uncharacterized membrane protein (DUF4010 family)